MSDKPNKPGKLDNVATENADPGKPVMMRRLWISKANKQVILWASHNLSSAFPLAETLAKQETNSAEGVAKDDPNSDDE
ncbi:hypothetical protein PG990_003177 [Apiospora arundinis]